MAVAMTSAKKPADEKISTADSLNVDNPRELRPRASKKHTGNDIASPIPYHLSDMREVLETKGYTTRELASNALIPFGSRAR